MPAPDLLSSVCHDLKDPLASIVMGAGFLKRTISTEDRSAQRVVEAIQRAAERMSQLITSFSDLARLGMHEVTLDVRPHDVGEVLNAAVQQLVRDGEAQGVPVSLAAGKLPTLSCDRDRLVQIIHHMGAAALRVVPEGGTVAVSAAADAGAGVRVEVVVKRRAGTTSRRISSEPPKPALALARGLVELHGGTFEVVGDGDALTLAFTLPDRR